MFLDQNRAIDSQPIAEQNQQGVQPSLEVVNANDPEHNVDDGSDEADEWPRDGLKPGVESLCGESEGVHVRDVVCDDPESEDDETELAEAAGWIEGRAEQTANGVLRIPFRKPGR